jgi:hypothetical protein
MRTCSTWERPTRISLRLAKQAGRAGGYGCAWRAGVPRHIFPGTHPLREHRVPTLQLQVATPSTPPGQAGAGTGTFTFDPPTLSQAKGSTFTINVMLSGGQNVYSVPVQLNYDPNQVQVLNVSNGGFLSQDGQAVALVHRDDPTTGTLQITATRPPGAGRRFGPGHGGDAHVHGEEPGPVCSDHHSGRGAGSGDAADCDERSAGGDYDSIEVLSSRFSVLSKENRISLRT